MSPQKLTASLSLDLDNKWSYLKTHGSEQWKDYPTFFDIVVPNFLEALDRANLEITVFVVGQDATREENHRALNMISENGHEIGNHSFKHEPWLHLYTEEDIESEIEKTENAIRNATGCTVNGFRGPGFSFSPYLLRTLKRRNYLYDASTFPTFLGPLARAYYFFNAQLSQDDKEKRNVLFGNLSDGLRSIKPYYWNLPEGKLLEIPVTTTPIFRIPFHLSYLLYLAGYSKSVARTYFKTAIQLCKLRRVEPSLLLHSIDFTGGDAISDLDFFPAMKMSTKDKMEFSVEILSEFSRHFDVVNMSVHANRILSSTSYKLQNLEVSKVAR